MQSLTSEQLLIASFPHATTDVTIRETHISFVVLTGEYAYKIKKAVHLDFIDTRSLQRRRELCEAELRLNGRYAAELYLDVVPVTLEAGRLRFGGTSAPIEYAVRMRQFDRGEELQALLETNSVEATELSNLAERLADFHREAAVLDEPDFRGTAAFVRKARENMLSVMRRAALIEQSTAAAELYRWTETELMQELDALREREQLGCIRECHGDLHSGNVVRWRGQLVPFDCIEFDAELRCVDVLNDLAFLIMDLLDRDRSDLAFTLLNRYLERRGDYFGVQLLPCYLSYRALIRAKVSLIALEQRADARDAAVRAASLMRTAARFTQAHQPALILMHGVSGSGKSWLSERLVPQIPALRIRSDLERKRLAGIDPMAPNTSPIDEGIYTREFNDRTYAHLLDCARACLRGRMNTIVDAAFLKLEERQMFASLAAQEGAEFLILSCGADRDTLTARIEQRRAARSDPSDADLNVLQRQLAAMQPIAESEMPYVLPIDTGRQHIETTVLDRLAALRSMQPWRPLRPLRDSS